METSKLKKYAQFARRSLIEQVSNKLDQVLNEDSAARRENVDEVKKLEGQIKIQGQQQVIEKVAYIWFNRFCALRFMDVNRYTHIGVVSPAEGQFQPEILAEAKMGHVDEDMVPEETRQQIFKLIDGSATSRDPQSEAYRLLVVAVCNDYHKAMPFLFERIADYTELLMPDDLLSGNSILAYTREAMTPKACEDVEVIGWLYQFYISEKKDQVFSGLKKNKKISPENIPAATQLFTPHWIVRYLVENSLGRLWMLNHPDSRLIEEMDYYIKPEQAETGFLRINKPEDLRICDPACGSGHMLTYTFDLLYAIYEEQGYDAKDIPCLILQKNLYGIEIDERAGELAAFALTMKALGKYRRFFRKPVQPNICVLENISFTDDTVSNYVHAFGQEIFSPDIVATLKQFEEANNFGSLIVPDAKHLSASLEALDVLKRRCAVGIGNPDELPKEQQVLVLAPNFKNISKTLRQADYLSPKYHVVVANPPYMGSKGMNGRLAKWAKDNYPNSKSDLFAMFIERNLDLAQKQGLVAMITMQSWMFLSSFEKLRSRLLGQDTILSMAHLGARAFDTIGGEVVSTTAFVLENSNHLDYKGGYLRLVEGNSEAEKESAIREAIQNPDCGWFYRSSADDFKKIPSSPIAYWVSEKVRDVFEFGCPLRKIAKPKLGMRTGNNERFVRFWSEVEFKKVGFNFKNAIEAQGSRLKWFPYNKGGDFRRWYGNNENLVNWENNGYEIKVDTLKNYPQLSWDNLGWKISNEKDFFKPCLEWSRISSEYLGVRISSGGFLFDTNGSSAFPKEIHLKFLVSFLCTKLSANFAKIVNPSLAFQPGDLSILPIIGIPDLLHCINEICSAVISISKTDWDSYETSWDFSYLPFLQPEYRLSTLKATYIQIRTKWNDLTIEMKRLEEENNRIFIETYGLQDELTPEVPLNEITLTCNPNYRYGGDKSEEELEALLLSDTLKEFISYAVGCMFGRYSLDKPSLILANQGETLADYLAKVPEPRFMPDEDNVIPVLDDDWFTDDITGRFRTFLRITFGESHYDENMAFIEQAIGKNIRRYLVKDFYNDHVKRYKKRPIYWLFSSPAGSFNALIYMHRYRSDTVSVVLNDYLREFRTKLTARKDNLEQVSISTAASQSEKTKALKEITRLIKVIDELDTWEREVLYPLATQQIEIDLDNGVKANYPEFSGALKKIPGLS